MNPLKLVIEIFFYILLFSGITVSFCVPLCLLLQKQWGYIGCSFPNDKDYNAYEVSFSYRTYYSDLLTHVIL